MYIDTELAAPHGTASTVRSRLAQTPPFCRSMEEPSWPSLA
jgi:hypothetical protein